MNLPLEIVCWHPVLTDHQAFTLKALKLATKSNLTVIVAAAEHKERKQQGWSAAQTDGLRVLCVPPKGRKLQWVIEFLKQNRNAIHIFGSPFENTLFMFSIFMAQRMGLAVNIISEPYSTEPSGYLSDENMLVARLKSTFRPTLYRFYGRLFFQKIGVVFAISNRAVDQYVRLGIPRSAIAPFGYFVPRTQNLSPRPKTGGGCDPLKVIFIGSLIHTKGLRELLGAVRASRESGALITLDAYGPGDPSKFDFDNTICCYCGTIPFGKSQDTIPNYDLLVLPSLYDGWGVVVNEAILSGVPVVCSDRVGASALVHYWKCGAVFSYDNPNELAQLLSKLASESSLRSEMASACSRARETISPEVAGRYMAKVLIAANDGAPLPSCPWY